MTHAPDPFRLRGLQDADAEACVELVKAVGWHSDAARWRMFFSLGAGFGVEQGGVLRGVVTVHPFGDALASIAMMMVDPAEQRRGLGRRLMRAAVDHAGPRATVFLYASDEGRPLYEALGFTIEGGSRRFEGPARTDAPAPHAGLRPICEHDVPALLALDERALGAPRHDLLRACLALADRALLVERGGSIAAFGLAWMQDGRRLLAPILARSSDDAVALADHLAAGSAAPIRIDLPDDQPALRAWAEAAGLVPAERSPLMVLGGRPLPGERALIHALAGRAFG